MQVLSPAVDWTGFLRRVSEARERVLMLDYDGTLAPFQIRPERALPYPGVAEALDALMRHGGTRIVIISGRSANDVAPLLALKRLPEIWGGHGWERLFPDGELRIQEPDAGTRAALASAEEAVSDCIRGGARLERKLASIALHWRGTTALSAAKLQERARAVWEPFTREGELQLLPFDGGLELRAQGCNKRHAVEAVLSETGPDSALAYLGDDITDEDAFVAIKPRGLAVLVRPEVRATNADVWLRPPRELIAFLNHWQTGRGQHVKTA